MPDSATGKPKAVPDLEPATLSPADAAKRAGCSRTTIRNAIEAHELEAYRDNRNRWRVRTDDLDDWVARRQADAVSKPMAASGIGASTENLVHIAKLETELDAARQTISDREARIQELKGEVADAKREAIEAREETRAERVRIDNLLEDRKKEGRGFWASIRRATGF